VRHKGEIIIPIKTLLDLCRAYNEPLHKVGKPVNRRRTLAQISFWEKKKGEKSPAR